MADIEDTIIAKCQLCGWKAPAASDEKAKKLIADHMNRNPDCLYKVVK